MSTFGVLISNRSFFPDHLVLTAREKLLRCLDDMGHRVITLSTEDTFMGQTMTRRRPKSARRCSAATGRSWTAFSSVCPTLGRRPPSPTPSPTAA